MSASFVPLTPTVAAPLPSVRRSSGPIIWDGITLVLALLVTAGFFIFNLAARGRPSLLLFPIGAAVLMAAAFDISLRAGTPNLAVAAVASVSATAGVIVDRGFFLNILAGIISALVISALMVLLISVLRLPSWVASFAVIGLADWFTGVALQDQGVRQLHRARFFDSGLLILAIGISASLLIGFTGYLGRPAKTTPSGLMTAAATVGSCLLAGMFGVAQLYRVGGATQGQNSQVTLLAIASVVAGGTGLHGKRGGIIGPLAAAVGLSVVSVWLNFREANFYWFSGVLVAVLVMALIIHALLDRVQKSAAPLAGSTLR
jgi:ribose/xylose/arabinose/galactoside ABC-type transport system permease subunit